MYDIKDLEIAWKRYKRKQYLPRVFVIVAITLMSGGGYYAYVSGLFDKSVHTIKRQAESLNEANKSDSTGEINTSLVSASSREKIKDAVEKNESSDLKRAFPINLDSVQVDGNEAKEDRLKASMAPINEEKKQKRAQKVLIEINDSNDPKVLKSIERRFKLGHDTDDSLFLARTYYRLGDYKKAEYWAYQTNRINNKIEESWLIFAKAKFRSGKKAEAIRILDAYIKKNDSLRARMLLEKMRKNTF